MAEPIALSVLNRQHWERPEDPARLGCSQCNDQVVCGGIRPRAEVFSCRDYCCGTPSACTKVCPKRPADFVMRRREVDGWELDNVPRVSPTAAPELPPSIPVIYHQYKRDDLLKTRAVALPMRVVLNDRATRVKHANKTALLNCLRVSPRARLVLDFTGRDWRLENYWAERNASQLIEAIARLRPAWMIAPNYSVITDVPRWDNLHAIKRIALTWSELSAAGVPTALPVNARTARDWQRWTEFVVARPEVQAIAVELATGGRYADRRAYMLDQARELGLAAGGRLRLFLRGGRTSIPLLEDSFASVHLLDTNPFMKSAHRQRVVRSENRVTSAPSFTLIGQSVEDLLQANVRASSRLPVIATARSSALEEVVGKRSRVD